MAILNGFIIAGLLLGPVSTGWAKPRSAQPNLDKDLNTAEQIATSLYAYANFLGTFPVDANRDEPFGDLIDSIANTADTFAAVESAYDPVASLDEAVKDLKELQEELQEIVDDGTVLDPGENQYIQIMSYLAFLILLILQ